MCTEECGVQGAAVFVGVHLYRVAPFLYNPILGVVWWVFSCSHLRPASSTQWMGDRVNVSVCLRVVFSAPNWRITASDQEQGPVANLNLSTRPCVPTPFFPIPSKIHLVALNSNHLQSGFMNDRSYFTTNCCMCTVYSRELSISSCDHRCRDVPIQFFTLSNTYSNPRTLYLQLENTKTATTKHI